MRINVSDILLRESLGMTTFTRRRPTTTLAHEGEASETYAETELRGIVQPAATADAQLLPEGVRLSDVQAFFTSSSLSVGDGATQNPDVIQFNGQTYRVIHVQDFGGHGMVKALAQRILVGTIPEEP